jgi:hypothetical protein
LCHSLGVLEVDDLQSSEKTMSGSKAVWDEVQGACDASRLQRALEAVGNAPLELDGWTPLHFASENRSAGDAARAAAIRTLTARGIDANAADEVGRVQARVRRRSV